jgi:hypothetical protein
MEPTTLDPNKIAAEFLQANLDRVVGFATGGVRSIRNVVRANLKRTYVDYLTRLMHRHSKAKSFFVRSEPIPLYDFFVPLDLRAPRRLLSSPDAADVAAAARCTLITGSGGSGKSMVMRHLLISSLRDRTKTPIFLELRQVDLAKEALEDALLTSLRNNGLEVDKDFLARALADGHFLLLLDGIDELDRKGRAKFTAAIHELAEQHPATSIIVSSRPDPALESWAGFTQLRVEPLNLDRATALVERLRFDAEVKDRFLNDLRSHLFQQHESFLSNPLLLSIMLLTYQDTAQIPGKLSIFYNQAYESLFQKHDALKGGFQRERRTPLDIQDFGRVFAAFCVRTYDKRLFTFSASTALEMLDRCKGVTHLAYDSRAFLDDAYQAVCLLVEEGIDISFAHRSFQEYFAARFVADAPPQVQERLIKRFARNQGVDAFITLLHEIDAFAIQKYYLLPTLERLRTIAGIKGRVGVTHHYRYLDALFTAFSIAPDPEHGLRGTIRDSPLFHALRFAFLHYGPPELHPPRSDKDIDPSQAAFVEAFGDGPDHISVSSLSSRHPFIREVAQSGGWWSLGHLRALVDIEQLLRRRIAEADASLDAILA